jgi:hypothetical protein
MGIFDSLFGKNKSQVVKSHQLPSDMVCKEFGEVDIRRLPDKTEVWFTILMEPQGSEAEGWQTGLALDASVSMQGSYGKKLNYAKKLKSDVPSSLNKEYQKKGWLAYLKEGGQTYVVYSLDGMADLVKQGYYEWTKNEIEPFARQMTEYLASNLDAEGRSTVVYWACGEGGNEIEVVGDLTAQECANTTFGGPKSKSFGKITVLTPVIKYFVDRFKDAKRGMYVFITDGELHDLEDVKRYTTELAKNIEGGKQNQIKFVLIGLGSDINEDQMEQLDDLDTGTDVDIWDHKIAKEMRALVEIFAEVVSEHQIVAPTATIYDDSGNVLQKFADGLPAKVAFEMSAASKAFELEVGNKRIRQTIESRKS